MQVAPYSVRLQSELPRPIPWIQISYVDNSVILTSHNVALTSQKPCQYNNKFDCSETNGYNIPKDAINEVYVFHCNIAVLKKT